MIQFSDGAEVDHMVRERINDQNRADKIAEIDDELKDSQMERGTRTYHALKHTTELIGRNNPGEITALFLITDGEPRDDQDQRFIDEVLDDVEVKIFFLLLSSKVLNTGMAKIKFFPIKGIRFFYGRFF